MYNILHTQLPPSLPPSPLQLQSFSASKKNNARKVSLLRHPLLWVTNLLSSVYCRITCHLAQQEDNTDRDDALQASVSGMLPPLRQDAGD